MTKSILNTLFISVFSILYLPKLLSQAEATQPETVDYTMVFASCNHQDQEQPLWKSILQNNPEIFIWGGDNIYADTDNMNKMEADYNKTKANPDYQELLKNTRVIGTWDDHDFGKNDAGADWKMKKEAQTKLLDFLDVPKDDIRRKREGVYASEIIKTAEGSIKVILLDTRYFRSPLKEGDKQGGKYEPWPKSKNQTVLGETQWNWLESELKDDSADFTVIVSSIQFLSDQHGWEKWANFPSEVDKMKKLLAKAKAKNIFILSGDRHFAEISSAEVTGMDYPLIDFTSSGLTHTYPKYPTEGNEFRIGNVIKTLNFAVIKFNFEEKKVTFEIRGENNFVYERFTLQY